MAYTLEEIKELVETLTPIVKNAIEAGSLSVEDLRVAESMDFVNSLPALEEKASLRTGRKRSQSSVV